LKRAACANGYDPRFEALDKIAGKQRSHRRNQQQKASGISEEPGRQEHNPRGQKTQAAHHLIGGNGPPGHLLPNLRQGGESLILDQRPAQDSREDDYSYGVEETDLRADPNEQIELNRGHSDEQQ